MSNDIMQDNCIHIEYEVSDQDFTRAGEASSNLKKRLKQLNIDPKAIRKVSIAMYEGEINMVIHANGGKILVDIYPDHVDLSLQDVGPGIPDIDRAMQVGYSTAPARIMALGFGAGMGLPNMKKNSDTMKITSVVGEGTTVDMSIKF